MTGRTLNSCQILPAAVLAHLGRQLDLMPPQLASIRGLYRRRRTLFEHQRVAMTALGFRHLTGHAERGLTAHLRRSAEVIFSADALIRAARVWLYEHGYVLPSDKRVALLVRGALRHAERALSRRIVARFSVATARLLNEIDPSHDSLRFYRLGTQGHERVEHAGAKPNVDLEGPLIF